MSSVIAIALFSLIAEAPEIELGEALFHDTRFSSRQGDMHTSCASCHLLTDPTGPRAFTELLSRSWLPWRKEDPRRETLRNTPTILDAAFMPRLHFDGEFTSLEEQAAKTLTGRNFGWLPHEKAKGRSRLHAVVTDSSEDNPYPNQFKTAYNVDVQDLSEEETLEWVARAISDYVRRQTSARNAPYDEFLQMNGLDFGPHTNESPKDYARRLMNGVYGRHQAGDLERPENFSLDALKGMRIFFTTKGTRSVGNCAACHVPPLFTDFDFHNTGVTQDEYDAAHGPGSFAGLVIPNLDAAERPDQRFMQPIDPGRPGDVDLGYWNYAPASSSDELDSAMAAFKTPTLRNLALTAPYMHSGNFPTLRHVLAQKARMSIGATTRDTTYGARYSYNDEEDATDTNAAGAPYAAVYQGEPVAAANLRNPDPEFTAINLSARDIPPLIAFLNTLDEKEVASSSTLYVTTNAN